jgi:hypothetical protein
MLCGKRANSVIPDARRVTRRVGLALAAAMLLALPNVAARIGNRQTIVETYLYAPGGRIGALCRDGSESFATGSGACSHHRGVARWRFQEMRERKIHPTFMARHEERFRRIGENAIGMAVIGVLAVVFVALCRR